jgi:esterase/lipase
MADHTELAQQQAAGLRALAQMIEDNPDVASLAGYLYGFSAFHVTNKDDAQTVIRAALAAGAKVDKRYINEVFVVGISFGAVKAEMLSSRASVCEKVVTTREVTEEVPDPVALASVPTVTQTRTVEDVQWVCSPILADTEPAVA